MTSAEGIREVLGPEEPVEPAAAGAALATAESAAPRRLVDVTSHELAAWVPLIALTVLFGLWPKALLAVTTPAVRAFLGAP